MKPYFAAVLKQFYIIILLVLLGLQSFYPLAIYSYYYGNQGYIASVLCENKDKPELQCKGKCYLKKQLKKAGEQQQKEKTSLKEIQPLVYLITNLLTNHQPNFSFVSKSFPVYNTDSYSFIYISSSFRPPGI